MKLLRAKPSQQTVLCVALLACAGCRRREFVYREPEDAYRALATEIEYPNAAVPVAPQAAGTPPPPRIDSVEDLQIWPLGLEQAVRIALANSQVIRDVGGRVISSPATVATVFDPAVVESNPVTGVEAALSAFDAQLATTLFFGRNERTLNNVFQGAGVSSLDQNIAAFRADITKRAATGTQFSVRNFTDYDRNSVPIPPNRFSSVYDTVFEAEVRQPLLQGAGIQFNRIAGPDARPGIYQGVLLGRIDTDISLADFEAAVREFLIDVERTYWQLYFAYRDLDAKVAARDAALQTWRAVRGRLEAGLPGADGESEALAREQYFIAQADVENALSGTAVSGLVVTTFGGVYTVERQLRFLLGLPPSDGRLIRPQDEPAAVDVVFDWEQSLGEALVRRVELRRQRWAIRRRELELVAARNFLRMRLDTVAQYRWRGFGDKLLGQAATTNNSAFQDLFIGDLQEWQLGLEWSTPIGNRVGHSAVRHAQWQLARQRALYREQEREVVRQLSASFSELDRAYQVTRVNYNRSVASYQRLQAVQVKYEVGESLLEFVIEAQRRAAEATSAYYRSLVNYSLAIMNVHRARGSLLEFNNVALAEGPWPQWAHASAARQARRFRRRHMDYCCTVPGNVSYGPVAAPARIGGEPVAPEEGAADAEVEDLPAPR